MNFKLSEEQRLIQDQIRSLCADFGDEYWRRKDHNHDFPDEFFDAFADDGWCGITIPKEYGGEGYGVQEAAIVQQEIARSGAAMAGTSVTSHHTFSAAPLVQFGSDDHKSRYLPDVAAGDIQVCTGVTEPNAGLNTAQIETTAERKDETYIVDGQKIWTSKAQEADVIMLLARTGDPTSDNKYAGLSMFFTKFDSDMESIDISEISKAGRGAADSNEVWFDSFRIPTEGTARLRLN